MRPSIKLQSLLSKLDDLQVEDHIKIFIKGHSTNSSLSELSKKEVIKRRLRDYIIELKAKVFEMEQNNMVTNKRIYRSKNNAEQSLKNRVRKQEAIFSRTIEKEINLFFGTKVISALNDLELENVPLTATKKTKKIQLHFDDQYIEDAEELLLENYSKAQNTLLSISNSFKKRVENMFERDLEKKDINSTYNSGKSVLHIASTPSISLAGLTNEVSNRGIGEYLMRARMVPMYIMMGASMFGFSLRSKLAGYLPSIMIFLMGISFFFIFRSKKKGEEEDKEKIYENLINKFSDDVMRKNKELGSSLKKTVMDDFKDFINDINEFYTKSTAHISDSSMNVVRRTSDLERDYNRKIEKLERVILDVDKLDF